MSTPRIRIVARLGGAPSGLSRFVLGSMSFHVVFVALLILWPSFRPSKAFPDNPIVVDLVAGPRTAARVQPPAPQPKAPRTEGVHLESREPPEVTPPPKKTPPPEQPAESPPPPDPGPEATGDPLGDETSGIVGEFGSGSLGALDSENVQFAWYRDSISAAFRSHWRRPILTGLVEPIEVRVAFVILRDGSVRELNVDGSSGVAVFDRAALRAVSDASPLPPLPGGWREPTLPALWVFRMFPE